MAEEIVSNIEVFFARVSDPSLTISCNNLFGDSTAVIVFIKSCSANELQQDYKWHIGFIGGVGEFNTSFIPEYQEMYEDGMIHTNLAKSAKELGDLFAKLFRSSKPINSAVLYQHGFGAYMWDERDYNMLPSKDWYLETTLFGTEKYFTTVIVHDEDAIKMVEEALLIKKNHDRGEQPYGVRKVWLGRPYKANKSVLSAEFMELILKRHGSDKVAA